VTDQQRIYVDAPARLHFGVLDLRGSLGRWFGGIGAAASAPTLLLSASPADTLSVEGEDAARAAEFARRFLNYHRLQGGAHLRVHRALPSHAGLGSGTQLALAVARALAELHGIRADAPMLARAVGRARRSAIGTWTFAAGGLVVEGGRHRDRDECGPLLARLSFPSDWRCVVAIPDTLPGISGTTEEEAFAHLPTPPEHDVERVAHLVLMAMLPAVADGDLRGFGAALTKIQEITGRWFSPVQGSTFAPGPTEELVHRMAEWGAFGVGQSSWGPTVYGIVEGDEAARRLADRVRDLAQDGGRVYAGPFRDEGARVWWSDR
jgi:beta-ribofuranosylaminobenzene 5'-phosphate synthase